VPPGMMEAVAFAGTTQPLVGRDAELTELGSLLGVRPSRLEPSALPNVVLPRAVLLSGDAGVGKTRLLTELRDVAFAEGWQVVAGHCLNFGDSALPYLPFSEIIGRLSTDLPDVVETVASLHPGLARLQPGRRMLSGEVTDSSSVDRGDLFEAMHAVLEAAAAKAPLLLVLEDAHWADHSTRDMISFLFSRPFAEPVAVVVSYRGEDLHRRHPLRPQVAEWSRIRGVERLQLNPLTPAEVRTLVRQLHPDPLAEAELAGIVDRAEGNAFFVEELVGATWAGGGRVPEDLADVLLVRLDRLDETAQHVVRLASVAGRRVSHDLLTAASGLPDEALDPALRAAVESHVVVVGREGTYSFRHALLGEAVYDDLLPGERVRLHAAYAEALREGRARGTAAELARHARAAMDLETALDASIRAGDEAMTVGGPDEAAHHYEHALELASDPRLAANIQLPALVVKAADALVATGVPARAHALLRRHLAGLPDTASAEDLAHLHIHVAHTASLYENDLDWQTHAETAMALAPTEPTALRAKLLGTYARVMAEHGLAEQARKAAMEALALAETHNLPKLASDATTTIVGLDKRVPIEELSVALEDAARRAVATGAINSELRALYFLGRGYQDRGDMTQACATFERAMERARASGIPWAPYAFDSRFQHAQVAYVAGMWDKALELTTFDGQSPPPTAEALLLAMRSVVLHARGDAEGAATAERLRQQWTRDGLVGIVSGPVLIDARSAAGDPTGAVRVLDELVAALTPAWRDMFQARVRLAAVGIAALADAVPTMSADERSAYAVDAERLLVDGRRVLDFHHRAGAYWGPEGRAWAKRLDAEILRFRWLAGIDAPPFEELVAMWQEAVTLFEDYGHLHEVAWTRTRLAGVLRAAGDLPGARAVADLARASARELGAQPILDELTSIGSAPSRGDAASDALTPREREILALVATGRSNGEIGKQLFISAKTVSVHVSNILGKLGASGRTEAAAIARRRGLLDA
jgi:DNA-binding CsgD family transcriptional regulator/tetratricopeptide (TPR) repeat protein